MISSRSSGLPDILEGGLDIVFVGINPGTFSALKGHYYARPANLFWTLLYESGLLRQPLKPEDDWKLIRFKMGLTDVVNRATDSSGDLSQEELRKGSEILLKKIKIYRPRVVCFNGLTGYRALFGPAEGPGPKEALIGESRVFVVPSTSRRNAFYSREEVLRWFRRLKDFVDGKGQGPEVGDRKYE